MRKNVNAVWVCFKVWGNFKVDLRVFDKESDANAWIASRDCKNGPSFEGGWDKKQCEYEEEK